MPSPESGGIPPFLPRRGSSGSEFFRLGLFALIQRRQYQSNREIERHWTLSPTEAGGPPPPPRNASRKPRKAPRGSALAPSQAAREETKQAEQSRHRNFRDGIPQARCSTGLRPSSVQAFPLFAKA